MSRKIPQWKRLWNNRWLWAVVLTIWINFFPDHRGTDDVGGKLYLINADHSLYPYIRIILPLIIFAILAYDKWRNKDN